LLYGADVSGKSHDKHFFDTFMLVLGVLVFIAFGLYFGARTISARTQERTALQDPLMQKAIEERIKPVGQVAISGEDNSALEIKAPAPAAPIMAKDLSGEEVYNMACVACHGAGLAGAPKFGDKGAWGPRISKGTATLHDHALKGFTGNSGTMPAKGGRVDLTDQSIVNAVDFMVAKGK
jgi:cytochrome c5